MGSEIERSRGGDEVGSWLFRVAAGRCFVAMAFMVASRIVASLIVFPTPLFAVVTIFLPFSAAMATTMQAMVVYVSVPVIVLRPFLPVAIASTAVLSVVIVSML